MEEMERLKSETKDGHIYYPPSQPKQKQKPAQPLPPKNYHSVNWDQKAIPEYRQ
jgi:hypothetical protein